jgi:dTDP-4-amino-4,6-dideoxygalactose transaminase
MSVLAIKGGIPVRTNPFPAWPVKNDKELIKLKEVWESGKWGVYSDYTKEFEEKFAKKFGAKYGLTAVNGTTSMWIALRAAGIGLGDEVIIPPYTFIATAVAVLLANAIPVFADIDPETYNIDPKKIEENITPKTKAIIAVHIGGMPCDMDAIMTIAKKHNLFVIEDAAQAHYASIKNKYVGTFGNVGSFSFQMSKNMTAGEGGILISDDTALMDKCFSFQNCGRRKGGAWYEHPNLASNNRMTAFQSAVLTEQIDFCEEISKKRELNTLYLADAVSKIDGLNPQRRDEWVTHSAYHLFVFRYQKEYFKNVHRDEFINALNAEGIPSSAGYIPLYRFGSLNTSEKEFPWLSGRDYNDLKLPVCEKACNEESIWFYQNLLIGEKSDIDHIIQAINKVKNNIDELI